MRHPPAVTAEKTIEALLERSNREAVPIRKAFVQGGTPARPVPGPLAELVRRHDTRGLDLYLMLHAAASGGDWTVTVAAPVWGRTLRLHGGQSVASTVSKTWKRLEDQRLVARARAERLTKVALLREDGSGEPYTHPASARERYFKLPHRYWTDPEQWFSRLPLAAKALLLVALSLPPEFVLPVERVPAWYGISGDTAQRGLLHLRREGLLRYRKEFKEAPLSPLGYTKETRYRLAGAFQKPQQRVLDRAS